MAQSRFQSSLTRCSRLHFSAATLWIKSVPLRIRRRCRVERLSMPGCRPKTCARASVATCAWVRLALISKKSGGPSPRPAPAGMTPPRRPQERVRAVANTLPRDVPHPVDVRVRIGDGLAHGVAAAGAAQHRSRPGQGLLDALAQPERGEQLVVRSGDADQLRLARPHAREAGGLKAR